MSKARSFTAATSLLASSSPLTPPKIYRSLLRELRLSSIQPREKRSQHLQDYLRSLVVSLPRPSAPEWDTKAREVLEIGAFVRAQRIHKDLLERYNPTHGMTTEQRTKATARRVGLDMPIEGKPMEG